MDFLAYLLARLKEPSSAAGIGLFLASLGIHAQQPTLDAVLQLLAALLGFIAVLVPEKGAPPHA